MKSKFQIQNIWFFSIIHILAATTAIAALGPTNAVTWGISNDELDIPRDYVITGARLTLHDAAFNDAVGFNAAYIHLMDNPDTDISEYIDTAPADFFGSHGVILETIKPEDLSEIPHDIIVDLQQEKYNDEASPFWSIFEQPFTVELADHTQIEYTSSMLSLVDYAGTGRSFGFGIDCDNFTCSALTLELTIQSLTEITSPQILVFRFGTPNTAPVLSAIPDQRMDVGQTLTFDIIATDADGDALTYTVSGLPDDSNALIINNTFTWTSDASHVGNYAVTFTANDGNGGTDTTTLDIRINGVSLDTMHVHSITVSEERDWFDVRGKAEVIIVDDAGNPVVGANVSGTFSGNRNETVSASTDATGAAVIYSKWGSRIYQLIFTVDNVAHTTFTYSPDDNIQISDSLN